LTLSEYEIGCYNPSDGAKKIMMVVMVMMMIKCSKLGKEEREKQRGSRQMYI
jgi:hypothetical protein